jgi:hypothetical protein
MVTDLIARPLGHPLGKIFNDNYKQKWRKAFFAKSFVRKKVEIQVSLFRGKCRILFSARKKKLFVISGTSWGSDL